LKRATCSRMRFGQAGSFSNKEVYCFNRVSG
jgi:hypothetical protein